MDMNDDPEQSRLREALPTTAIEVAKFYPSFAKAVKKTCAECEISQVDQEALINQLLLHAIQFQSNNNVIHIPRHVGMAVNIIREYGIETTDSIITNWVPVLLATTAIFINLKLVERTPIWRLVAHVDGTLYITPE